MINHINHINYNKSPSNHQPLKKFSASILHLPPLLGDTLTAESQTPAATKGLNDHRPISELDAEKNDDRFT